MKKYIPHISVCVIIIFALTSIMQYHHHDCEGNIYIHLTTFEDLVIGSSKHAIEHCNHDHACTNHQHRQHHVSCSMHLGDYKASEATTIDAECMTMAIPLFLSSYMIGLPDDIPTNILIVDAEYYDCSICESISSTSALRAPPVC